jgi:hypothetical protein
LLRAVDALLPGRRRATSRSRAPRAQSPRPRQCRCPTLLVLLLPLLLGCLGSGPASATAEREDDSAPDQSGGIQYHAFVEKFRTRVEHSSTMLTPKEVFNILDADYNKQVSNEELKAFSELVPPPAMPKAHFLKKFGRSSAAGVFHRDVVEQAFEHLDQDGDGHLGGAEETAAIVATLQRFHKEKARNNLIISAEDGASGREL